MIKVTFEGGNNSQSNVRLGYEICQRLQQIESHHDLNEVIFSAPIGECFNGNCRYFLITISALGNVQGEIFHKNQGVKGVSKIILNLLCKWAEKEAVDATCRVLMLDQKGVFIVYIDEDIEDPDPLIV